MNARPLHQWRLCSHTIKDLAVTGMERPQGILSVCLYSYGHQIPAEGRERAGDVVTQGFGQRVREAVKHGQARHKATEREGLYQRMDTRGKVA